MKAPLHKLPRSLVMFLHLLVPAGLCTLSAAAQPASVAAATVSPQENQVLPPVVVRQVSAIQAEKAARKPAELKLDSQLLYLARETAGVAPVAGAPGLRSRVHLESDGRVLVELKAVPNAALRQAISEAGGTVVYESPRWASVSAKVPPSALARLAARAEVKRVAQVAQRLAHTGSVDNAADPAQRAPFARTNYSVTGAGVKVGVISSSCDYYTNSVASGDLPRFTFLPGRSGIPDSGEGTAMAEIVADMAPEAEVVFATAGLTRAYFADSILLLHSNGCKVIVDDISMGEWQFQDDEIGQAVNTVVANGALYLSSSGNEGNLLHGNSTTWEGDFADGGAATAPLPTGRVHSFGTLNYNQVTDWESGASLQWSDEYHTSTNDYDLYVLSPDGSSIVAASTNPQNGTEEPSEYVPKVNVGERLVIFKNPAAAARYLRLSCTGSPLLFQTAGQTIGHSATPNCICVASTDASKVAPGAFSATNVCEAASSDGPHKMFYYPDGAPITPGNYLASGGATIPSPTLTAGDGGMTTVVVPGNGFSPFYGTSAAAPAAAGIAALVWSRNPSLSNSQVRRILEHSCIDIMASGFDVNSGQGILMADLALANTPAVSLTPIPLVATVTGTTLNLSWPADHIGWRLQVQTNDLAHGISANLSDWTVVPGSLQTNLVSIPLDPAKATEFYRLIYP